MWTASRHAKPKDTPSATVPVVHTGRTSSATWHGPGRAVIYPVVHLCGLVDPIQRTRAVEASVIDTMWETWDLPVHRAGGHAGVRFTEEGRCDHGICAIGLKVARGAIPYGITLNIDIDPVHAFEDIIPCGLTDADTTSLSWKGVYTMVSDAVSELPPRMVEHILPCLVITPTSVSYMMRSAP